MKFLVKATIDVPTANAQMRRAGFGDRMRAALAGIGAEATYYAIEDGNRVIYLVVDVERGADLPLVAEPLWLVLEATVELVPLITPEEMAAVAPQIHALVPEVPS